MKIQKQKLIDLFKKHQHKTTQTNKLKKILKFKKKRLRSFENFETHIVTTSTKLTSKLSH